MRCLKFLASQEVVPVLLECGGRLPGIDGAPARGPEAARAGLPWVVAGAGGLLAVKFAWTLLVSRERLEMVLPVRASLILMLLACLLVWSLVAPKQSAHLTFLSQPCHDVSGHLQLRSVRLPPLHFVLSNRTELELARWLGSHGAAVALQATLGALVSLAVAYLSYEFFESRFLRLKRLFGTSKEPAT
jgi:hypothetical protein